MTQQVGGTVALCSTFGCEQSSLKIYNIDPPHSHKPFTVSSSASVIAIYIEAEKEEEGKEEYPTSRNIE